MSRLAMDSTVMDITGKIATDKSRESTNNEYIENFNQAFENINSHVGSGHFGCCDACDFVEPGQLQTLTRDDPQPVGD